MKIVRRVQLKLKAIESVDLFSLAFVLASDCKKELCISETSPPPTRYSHQFEVLSAE